MRKILKRNIINFLFVIYLELLFKVFLSLSFSINSLISVLIYSIFTSFVITILTTNFKEKTNKILSYIIYFILCLWFALQYVFKTFLKNYFTLSLIKLSDQAVGFLGTTIDVVFSNLIYIILFFLPFIIIIIFRKKINYDTKSNKKNIIIYIILIILSYGIYNLYLSIDKNKELSLYQIYHNLNNIPLSIEKLGVLPSMGVDFYFEIVKPERDVVSYSDSEYVDLLYQDKNIKELDLSDDNLDSEVKKYIESNSGTNKNEYTSYFEGKNLILLVAESYSEIAVSEEMTPTTYRLTHNGFVFNNFYVPYYLSTIGGEYQTLTGLYPNTDILSTWKSGENSFPYGIANSFKNKGYNTYAYHGHDGHFQNRYKYLKSLGFDNFKACSMGLDINCDSFPESDIEMIDKTYNDYIDSDKPFMAYYMTISGHLYYNFTSNAISIKNKSFVDDLSYSNTAKAYLASQIELDRALELLINKLEEKGKLDDTVIIMLADHYPYGLSLEEINELSSYERDDTFEINHNSLIIWNNKMDTKEVDKVGMPIDVLPTIYNLFGIDYDSRLFAGSDLFSDREGLVILNNLSWITDRGKYISTTNEFTGKEDNNYISKINNDIQNKIIFSKNILLNDSYKYIKEK